MVMNGWTSSPTAHKLAAITESFSFVSASEETILDISNEWTTLSTSRSCYLNNSWHLDAHAREVAKDLENLEEWTRASVWEAHESIVSGHLRCLCKSPLSLLSERQRLDVKLL